MSNKYPAIKPVLVTGSPRSGTTWVGRMLALSPMLNYIHEPFNPDVNAKLGREICNVKFEQHFTYICEDNGAKYYKPIKRMFEGKYNWQHGLLNVRSLNNIVNALSKWRSFAIHRNKGGVPLIKDPIALMSAPWLNNNFDIHCIVMIRHPAAFVASMKRLEWSSSPGKWALSQELLLRDYLGPLEDEIRVMQKGKHGLIERASLAWKLHHYVIHKYKEKYKDWVFLRHEDISQNPVDSFESLYQLFGLPFTESIKQAIYEHCDTSNPSCSTKKDRPIKLNSRANVTSWKDKLSPDEVHAIRENVEDVSKFFYTDSDWYSNNESIDQRDV